MSRWHYWRAGVVALLAAATVLVWTVVVREDRQGWLTVAFLDVGQGDAIYIEAPNGNQVLVDGGPGSRVLAALGEVMPFYDRSLDVVVATHPDADHIGGLVPVLERYQVAGVVESDMDGTTALAKNFGERVQAEAATVVRAEPGLTLDLGGGARLEVLWPPVDFVSGETNEHSVIMRLVYGEEKFLLTGDASERVERALLARGADVQADVLKVGHHGSKSSSGEAFLAAVRPEVAVISVGEHNRYGHPTPEVLARLQKIGAQIVRTDEAGTIVFMSDGYSLVKK